jgi:D-alanyl-lipoteichoic acid acyltransferase DltB (MBOAT superfamily)
MGPGGIVLGSGWLFVIWGLLPGFFGLLVEVVASRPASLYGSR